MKHIFRLFTVTLALLCLAILPAASASAQDNGERAEYSRIMGELVKIKEQPTVEVMLKAALLRQGTRYVAGTLEVEPEQLVVKLKETDCILYVESCLALALTAQSSDTSYAAFCDNIRKLRYRDGKIDGYPSRIHYTSEWILQAEKNGYVKEMSKEIAGTPLNQKFSFMSKHADRYKQLASAPAEELLKISEMETELNSHKYWYIPKEDIEKYASKIKAGDIVGFCTSNEGLDLSHVGIVVWLNGKLTFIHASMGAMKVWIEPRTLQEYANSIKSNVGIRIIRVL